MKNNVTTNKPAQLSRRRLASEIVNDKHSQLNPTFVQQILKPSTVFEVQKIIQEARHESKRLAIAGGRHAMGGQQFLSKEKLIDMTSMKKVLRFDQSRGLIKVEAGIDWTEVIEYLSAHQLHTTSSWSIAQKQTGCDRLTIGGSLSANMHGRVLNKSAFVEDIEEFDIVLSNGAIKRCSRHENQELFALAIGGYGLFGVITTVTLRLIKSCKLMRRVRLTSAADLIDEIRNRVAENAQYGDFQFSIDHESSDFLQTGILSTYHPIDLNPLTENIHEQKSLSRSDWEILIGLAHTNKSLAFEKYVQHYLATDGQIYSSDTMQLSTYVEGYHERLNGEKCSKGSEIITELYVPKCKLSEFLEQSSKTLRAQAADVIYGTVRLIETDNESFLPWARESSACVIFNLHVAHSETGISKNKEIFRRLIQNAIELGGSFYLTYHRYATRDQILSCYPQIFEFFQLKRRYDAHDMFGSDWSDSLQKLVGISQ